MAEETTPTNPTNPQQPANPPAERQNPKEDIKPVRRITLPTDMVEVKNNAQKPEWK